MTGLIIPYRPTSLEAVARKNAVSHVGKLYNVLALHVAREVAATLPDVLEAQVMLLSQIGQPLGEPLVAEVNVRWRDGGLTPARQASVVAVLQAGLDNIEQLRRTIARGEIALF